MFLKVRKVNQSSLMDNGKTETSCVPFDVRRSLHRMASSSNGYCANQSKKESEMNLKNFRINLCSWEKLCMHESWQVKVIAEQSFLLSGLWLHGIYAYNTSRESSLENAPGWIFLITLLLRSLKVRKVNQGSLMDNSKTEKNMREQTEV